MNHRGTKLVHLENRRRTSELLFSFWRVHTLEQKPWFGIQHLTGEPEPRSFQSAETFTRGYVPSTVTGSEILKNSPNHPDIAGLDALSNVVEETLALLWRDTSLR
jgi:hypothetical protein